MNNPIIQEVRAVREALAAKFDFDLHRIYADAVGRQATQKSVNRQPSPNKASLLTPDPSRVPAEMTVQALTRRRSNPPGQE